MQEVKQYFNLHHISLLHHSCVLSPYFIVTFINCEGKEWPLNERYGSIKLQTFFRILNVAKKYQVSKKKVLRFDL